MTPSLSAPSMLPRGPAAGCSYASVDDRIVRFDDECILIPAPTKKPAMVTMSYSLPLWRKKPSYISHSDTEGTEVTFKVPVPR